jgi:hypothetical protein
MFSRATATVLSLAFLAVAAAPAEVPRTTYDPDNLVVHEWGTFTSIAGEDGTAVEWWPLDGQSDLPCFVYRNRMIPKGLMSATVRMETPVIYFYTPRPATVDVTVRFRQGFITEWFPRAAVATPDRSSSGYLLPRGSASAMKWEQVRITPRGDQALPTEPAPSHYYAARDTDAALLHVDTETDKFLFYRGIGSFALPVTATVGADGRVHVKSADGAPPLGAVVLFDNHNGRLGYRIVRNAGHHATVEMPGEAASFADLRISLERLLVAEGLYAKEASAMVETWKDSWFEEGTRLFYILPKPSVDTILPLEINPSPSAMERVFVGRLELVTPAMLERVRQALVNEDVDTLAKHGRFVRPIINRLIGTATPKPERSRIDRLLQSAHNVNLRPTAACR